MLGKPKAEATQIFTRSYCSADKKPLGRLSGALLGLSERFSVTFFRDEMAMPPACRREIAVEYFAATANGAPPEENDRNAVYYSTPPPVWLAGSMISVAS